ncbi:uncharacterized protein CMU_011740 [Cryptosporidium muris RN66]|uniref:Uncharacterized protein n=1 Tax=Cryptosporidium muris (strain RN66) TaxID=441375 RepID=B6AJ31_CRYMR|nr:uncharacterized protein CMU_011740 [Cryptosporidium muris RN66]EEA08222.1 hypothetical protein, conserved [Cryptosporidium muris RN66]|eukprot:XP_002142571.1 hypothetical protein [Cryptosporidium muris RN66]
MGFKSLYEEIPLWWRDKPKSTDKKPSKSRKLNLSNSRTLKLWIPPIPPKSSEIEDNKINRNTKNIKINNESTENKILPFFSHVNTSEEYTHSLSEISLSTLNCSSKNTSSNSSNFFESSSLSSSCCTNCPECRKVNSLKKTSFTSAIFNKILCQCDPFHNNESASSLISIPSGPYSTSIHSSSISMDTLSGLESSSTCTSKKDSHILNFVNKLSGWEEMKHEVGIKDILDISGTDVMLSFKVYYIKIDGNFIRQFHKIEESILRITIKIRNGILTRQKIQQSSNIKVRIDENNNIIKWGYDYGEDNNHSSYISKCTNTDILYNKLEGIEIKIPIVQIDDPENYFEIIVECIFLNNQRVYPLGHGYCPLPQKDCVWKVCIPLFRWESDECMNDKDFFNNKSLIANKYIGMIYYIMCRNNNNRTTIIEENKTNKNIDINKNNSNSKDIISKNEYNILDNHKNSDSKVVNNMNKSSENKNKLKKTVVIGEVQYVICSNNKSDDIHLKEKELELKRREMDIVEKEMNIKLNTLKEHRNDYIINTNEIIKDNIKKSKTNINNQCYKNDSDLNNSRSDNSIKNTHTKFKNKKYKYLKNSSNPYILHPSYISTYQPFIPHIYPIQPSNHMCYYPIYNQNTNFCSHLHQNQDDMSSSCSSPQSSHETFPNNKYKKDLYFKIAKDITKKKIILDDTISSVIQNDFQTEKSKISDIKKQKDINTGIKNIIYMNIRIPKKQIYCKFSMTNSKCICTCCNITIHKHEFQNYISQTSIIKQEYEYWGLCNNCQYEIFPSILSFNNSNIYFEFLFESNIPIAFPSKSIIWKSALHLLLAQYIKDITYIQSCNSYQQIIKLYIQVNPMIDEKMLDKHIKIILMLKIFQHPLLQSYLLTFDDKDFDNLRNFWIENGILNLRVNLKYEIVDSLIDCLISIKKYLFQKS